MFVDNGTSYHIHAIGHKATEGKWSCKPPAAILPQESGIKFGTHAPRSIKNLMSGTEAEVEFVVATEYGPVPLLLKWVNDLSSSPKGWAAKAPAPLHVLGSATADSNNQVTVRILRNSGTVLSSKPTVMHIGISTKDSKSVELPGLGWSVSENPHNQQQREWTDKFSVEVDGSKLIVHRTDKRGIFKSRGWGQDLQLLAKPPTPHAIVQNGATFATAIVGQAVSLRGHSAVSVAISLRELFSVGANVEIREPGW